MPIKNWEYMFIAEVKWLDVKYKEKFYSNKGEQKVKLREKIKVKE